MLTEQLQASLNGLLNAQFYSAYGYFAGWSYFMSMSMEGLAAFLLTRAKGELKHVTQTTRYLAQQCSAVQLTAIEAPPTSYGSPEMTIQELCRMEERMGGLLDDLLNLAAGNKDHLTYAFLLPLLKVQLTQHSEMMGLAQKITRFTAEGQGIHLLDHDLKIEQSCAGGGERRI